jgi:regulatory associated protein of mTOR
VFLSMFVKRHQNKFMVAAFEQLVQERDIQQGKEPKLDEKYDVAAASTLSAGTIYGIVWIHIVMLSCDPNAEVARNAAVMVDYVHDALLNSPLRSRAMAVMDEMLRNSRRHEATPKRTPSRDSLRSIKEGVKQTPPPSLQKQSSYLGLGSLKRTASTLRQLAFGVSDDSSKSPSETPVNTPTKPSKPAQPLPPTHTPRARLPAEWSRAPNADDQLPSLVPYQKAPTPPCAGMTPSTPTPPSALPLPSALFSWSTEYFREPQMRAHDPDEPGSADYNARLWRRTRNEKIIAENQPLKSAAGSSKWIRLEGFINNASQPMHMSFHQFDDHLAVTDDKDTVSVWDWARNVQLSRFSNGNPTGSRINDARFMNEDDHQPLLLVGSSDGVLKVYRHYWESQEVNVVAAWRALTELIPSNRNAGLVFDWQQGQGRVLAAGDTRIIRIWNAATELCVADIPARSSSCVTSLTSDQVAGDVFVAGFGDGVVRVFDQRLHVKSSMVRAWREHRQWVTNVKMQRGGVRELVSASRNGEVKLWDLRSEKSVLSFNVGPNSGGPPGLGGDVGGSSFGDATVRTLSVHEHAPVFALGTDRNEIRTFSTSGAKLGVYEPLSTAKGLVGVGGGAKKPIVATAYHPHKMMLACAARGNGHVSLIGY